MISHGAAISACEKGAKWECALKLLEEAGKCSLKPDVISHSALISTCEKGSKWAFTLGPYKTTEGQQVAARR
jgi:pentatricopeptide repeat domain-containing protein 1